MGEERYCTYTKQLNPNKALEQNSATAIEWYALRILHNKSSEVCSIAQRDNIEHFTPMRTTERVVDGRTVVSMRPIMPSLLFVRCTTEYISLLATRTNSNVIAYCTPGTSKPQPIPDSEMELFRFVTRTASREIELLPNDVELGDRVRITGGIFSGVEGYIHRIHGTKRLVVAIEGISVVATTYIPKQYIQKIV